MLVGRCWWWRWYLNMFIVVVIAVISVASRAQEVRILVD